MVLSIKCFQGIRIKPDSATCTQKGTPHGVPYRQYLREFDIPGLIDTLGFEPKSTESITEAITLTN